MIKIRIPGDTMLGERTVLIIVLAGALIGGFATVWILNS